jgi:hypothetical protein
MNLLPGDIVLTRGSNFIAKAILFFQRTKKESPSIVNHSGVSIIGLMIVEALSRVMFHDLVKQYGGTKESVVIFRRKDLTVSQRQSIADLSMTYVGKDYGYLKIAAHMGDWLLGGKYFFRKMAGMDKYPICSWVVSHAYFKAVGVRFLGLDPNYVEPDDIWDEVTKNYDKWECILPLQYLPKN